MLISSAVTVRVVFVLSLENMIKFPRFYNFSVSAGYSARPDKTFLTD